MAHKDDIGPGEAARLLGVATGTLANWRIGGSYLTGPRFRKRGNYQNAPVVYSRRAVIAWGKARGYIAQAAR